MSFLQLLKWSFSLFLSSRENVDVITYDFFQPFSSLSCSGNFKWYYLIFLSSNDLHKQVCQSGFLYYYYVNLIYFLLCSCEVVFFFLIYFPESDLSKFPFLVIVCACVLLISITHLEVLKYTYINDQELFFFNLEKSLSYQCQYHLFTSLYVIEK